MAFAYNQHCMGRRIHARYPGHQVVRGGSARHYARCLFKPAHAHACAQSLHQPGGPALFDELPESLKSYRADLVYVTDRKWERDEDGVYGYGYGRSQSTAFGTVTVGIGPVGEHYKIADDNEIDGAELLRLARAARPA